MIITLDKSIPPSKKILDKAISIGDLYVIEEYSNIKDKEEWFKYVMDEAARFGQLNFVDASVKVVSGYMIIIKILKYVVHGHYRAH